MKKQKFDKRILKKNPEELEAYLQFQRRGSVVGSKKGKGKGSYKRKSKHANQQYDKCA